ERRLLERDFDFAERRFAAERFFVAEQLGVRLARRDGRQAAVHIVLKEGLQFGLPLFFPLLARGDARAVEHDERIGVFRPRGELIDGWKVGRESDCGGEGHEKKERGGERESGGVGESDGSAPKGRGAMSVSEANAVEYLAC